MAEIDAGGGTTFDPAPAAHFHNALPERTGIHRVTAAAVARQSTGRG